MAKLTLTDLSNLEGNPSSAQTAINANNAALEAALENTLSRDGTSPNSMQAQLDMDSFRIINLPVPVDNQDPATKAYVDSLSAASPYTTADTLGAVLFNTSQAEISAGVAPTHKQYIWGDVRRYGAVLDGTTDDSTAFQAACHAGVGTVTIPYSTGGAKISVLVTIPSYTKVVGIGMPTLKQGTNDVSIFSVTDKTDIEITGIAFDGNSKGTIASTYNNCAIMSQDTAASTKKNVSVHHCRFKGFYSWCVSFAGLAGGSYSYAVRIHDNYIENQVDEGINLYYMRNCWVTNNEIYNHAKEAIKATTCDDIIIKGNRILAAATGATDGPLINVGTDCNEITIEGNRTYKGNKGIGIEKRVLGLQIIGNYCSDCLQEGIGVASTTGDTVPMRRVVIANNRTYNTGQMGINVTGLTSYEAEKVVIANNNIYNCGTDTAAAGIQVFRFVDVVITGNVIDTGQKEGIITSTGTSAVIQSNRINNVQQHGIRVTTVTDSVIEGNAVYDANRSASTYDGINVDSACTNAIVSHNITKALSGTISNGVDNQATTAHVLYNIVSGNSGNAVQLASGFAGGIGNLSQLIVNAAAPTVAAGQLSLGATTASTVGAAGGASALPATPSGYLIVNIAGTNFKLPYYAN